MIREILVAVSMLGALSLVLGLLITLVLKFFEIKKDPMEEELLEILPGANCGACGYPGCEQFAVEVVKTRSPSLICPVGKQDTADKIKELLNKYKSEDKNE